MTNGESTKVSLSTNAGSPIRGSAAIRQKPTIILFSSLLLMSAWWSVGSARWYVENLSSANSREIGLAAAAYQFVGCLILLGVIPALIVKLVFRERLVDYGVGLGNRMLTVRSFLIAAPAFIFFGYLSVQAPGMSEAYPINKQLGITTPFLVHAFLYAFYYIGWEFHFRGFLQYGLADSIGRPGGLAIQVIASSLLHIGQPSTELIGAIAGGILWGWLAVRTKSILSGTLQHILLGLTVDAAIMISR